MTQKQLAELIDIKPSTLSDYLNLRSNPSHGVIQKLLMSSGLLKVILILLIKKTTTSQLCTISSHLRANTTS